MQSLRRRVWATRFFENSVPDAFDAHFFNGLLGTAPLRPAGENTSPVRTTAGSNWNGHLFVALDARWVLHDITLDGNTFKSGHSVDKRPLVADVGYGVAITQGNWRISIARYHRTREFRGQNEIPVYGTITVGRKF